METALTDRPGDRRHAARFTSPESHRIRAARIRAGGRAAIIDASAAGILVETCRPLRPGGHVELHMETDLQHRAIVRGRVLRCAVSKLSDAGVAYRGAVLFDRHLPWLADDESARAASTPEHRPGRPERAHPTHTVL